MIFTNLIWTTIWYSQSRKAWSLPTFKNGAHCSLKVKTNQILKLLENKSGKFTNHISLLNEDLEKLSNTLKLQENEEKSISQQIEKTDKLIQMEYQTSLLNSTEIAQLKVCPFDI